jgi:hypothetical protein
MPTEGQAMTSSVRAFCVYAMVALVGATALACQSSDRYIVTTSEIDALGVRGLNLCFAVEPTNPQGVWWWHQGRSGCVNRSSGVMLGYRGKVTRQPSGSVEATFEVPMKVGEPRPVQLVFSDGTVRAVTTGATVTTFRRSKLDMREKL